MYKKKFVKHKKSKHKPPSRIRYERKNPVVSFRTKKEWKDEFMQFLKNSEQSIGDFFRIAFKKQKANYKRAKTRGYNNGYNQAKIDWQIKIPCNYCQEDICLYPNSAWHDFIKEYIKKSNWAHKRCHNKNQSHDD